MENTQLSYSCSKNISQTSNILLIFRWCLFNEQRNFYEKNHKKQAMRPLAIMSPNNGNDATLKKTWYEGCSNERLNTCQWGKDDWNMIQGRGTCSKIAVGLTRCIIGLTRKKKEKKKGQRMLWAGITGPSSPSPPHVTLIAPDHSHKVPRLIGSRNSAEGWHFINCGRHSSSPQHNR